MYKMHCSCSRSERLVSAILLVHTVLECFLHVVAESPGGSLPSLHADKGTGHLPSGNEITEIELKLRFRDHHHEGEEGTVRIELHKEWAPHGYKRMLDLLGEGFFTDLRFFRTVPRFVTQFGISGDPKIAHKWRLKTIKYMDQVKVSNSRGTLTFAMDGDMRRTSQVFINLEDNTHLDGSGFAPIGKVVEGMHFVDRIYSGYGDHVDQGHVQMEGNAYIDKNFPLITVLESTRIIHIGGSSSSAEETNDGSSKPVTSKTSSSSSFWWGWFFLAFCVIAGCRYRKSILQRFLPAAKKEKRELVANAELNIHNTSTHF